MSNVTTAPDGVELLNKKVQVKKSQGNTVINRVFSELNSIESTESIEFAEYYFS